MAHGGNLSDYAGTGITPKLGGCDGLSSAWRAAASLSEAAGSHQSPAEGQVEGPYFAFEPTNARVLDGTEVFPLDLEVLMTTLTTRAARLVGLRRGALHEAMTLELAPLQSHPEATPVAKPLQTRSLIRWTDGLEVTTVFLDAQDFLGPPVPLPVHCAPGQPCAQQVIRNAFSVHGTVAVRQRVSATGVLVEETVFEPRVVTTIR